MYKLREVTTIMQTNTYYIGALDRDGATVTLEQALRILDGYWHSYTVVEGHGRWEGESEPCFVVTVCGEAMPYVAAVELCLDFNQNAVLFSEGHGEARIVEHPKEPTS